MSTLISRIDALHSKVDHDFSQRPFILRLHDQNSLSSIEDLEKTHLIIIHLGYGDITPMSGIGKFFSSGLMVLGALIMTIPVLGIIIKFFDLLLVIKEEENEEHARMMSEAKNDVAIAMVVTL